MNERLVSEICQEVYRRFPETRGARPKIQHYGAGKTDVAQSSARPSTKYLLIFKSQNSNTAERPVPFFVRVIVNSQGKILRMTMSR